MKDEIKKYKVYNIKNLSQLEQIYNIFKNAGIKMLRDEFNYKSVIDYDGSWNNGSYAGLFFGSLYYAPTYTVTSVGFGCVGVTKWIKVDEFIEKFGSNMNTHKGIKQAERSEAIRKSLTEWNNPGGADVSNEFTLIKNKQKDIELLSREVDAMIDSAQYWCNHDIKITNNGAESLSYSPDSTRSKILITGTCKNCKKEFEKLVSVSEDEKV